MQSARLREVRYTWYGWGEKKYDPRSVYKDLLGRFLKFTFFFYQNNPSIRFVTATFVQRLDFSSEFHLLSRLAMKSAFILGALAGLAAAAPAPQLMDLDEIAAIEIPAVGPSSEVTVAQPDAFDAAAATRAAAASIETASTKVKRSEGDCAPQPSRRAQKIYLWRSNG